MKRRTDQLVGPVDNIDGVVIGLCGVCGQREVQANADCAVDPDAGQRALERDAEIIGKIADALAPLKDDTTRRRVLMAAAILLGHEDLVLEQLRRGGGR